MNSSICCILGCDNLLYKNNIPTNSVRRKNKSIVMKKKLDLEWSRSTILSLHTIHSNSFSPSAMPHDTVNLRWFTEGLWNHSVWELFIPVLRSLPQSCLERRRGHMWREKKSSFLQIILSKLEQDPILEGEYSPQIN